MRGSIATMVLVVLGVGAVTCGPPPPVLTGTLNGTWGCREDNSNPMIPRPGCTGGTFNYSNNNTMQGTPVAGQVLSCIIDNSGSVPYLNFTIGLGSGNNPTEGVAVCAGGAVGSISTDSFVTGYFTGPRINNVRPPTCNVQIRTVQQNMAGNGFDVSGSIRCADAIDDLSPGRLRFIAGTTGASPTMDPMRADFNFATCSPRPGSLSSCR